MKTPLDFWATRLDGPSVAVWVGDRPEWINNMWCGVGDTRHVVDACADFAKVLGLRVAPNSIALLNVDIRQSPPFMARYLNDSLFPRNKNTASSG